MIFHDDEQTNLTVYFSFMMFQNPPEYQESDSVSSMSSNVSSSSDRNDDTINNLTAEFRNVAYSSDEEYNSISS